MEKDITYRNSYAYVERMKEGKKVQFKVFRTDGSLVHSFSDKEKAIKHATHLETWRPLWTGKSKDD